jgi:hypothetical protein
MLGGAVYESAGDANEVCERDGNVSELVAGRGPIREANQDSAAVSAGIKLLRIWALMRARKTLNFRTPAERFDQCVASTG